MRLSDLFRTNPISGRSYQERAGKRPIAIGRQPNAASPTHWVLILPTVAAISVFATPASAIEESEINAVLQSRICPAEKIDTRGMPNYRVCKPYEPDWWKVNDCQNQQDRIWKRALEYNKIYDACHKRDSAKSEGSAKANKPSGGALLKASQAAQERADKAYSKAREAPAEATKKKEGEEAEKQRLKQLASDLPSWCQGMVRTCDNRANMLSNASDSTRSQCRAYCQILQIENCNPASSTVLQASNECTAGAERDQKEATRRTRAQQAARERNTEGSRRDEAQDNSASCDAAQNSCYAQNCKGRFNQSDTPVVRRDYECSALCRQNFLTACRSAGGDISAANNAIRKLIVQTQDRYGDDPPTAFRWSR